MEEQGCSDRLDDGVVQEEVKPHSNLVFGVNQRPPFNIALFYGLQVTLSVIAGPVTVAFVIHKQVCAEGDVKLLADLIAASMFSVGVCTLLQVSIGTRLPILQGSSILYATAIMSTMDTDKWRCPDQHTLTNDSSTIGLEENVTGNGSMTSLDLSHLWRPRILEVSGGLLLASTFHFLMGALGIVGVMRRFIGPLTVAPVIGMVGISLYSAINATCIQSWAVALSTVAITVISGVVLGTIMCPIPLWNRRQGCHSARFPIFKIFASNFGLVFGWLLCLVLTLAGTFPDDSTQIGYYARTDAKLDAIRIVSWFHVPYPGQWGWPTFSVASALGFLPVVVGSIIESIGDYIACAAACELATPGAHVMNRGIAIEGLGSMIASMIGTCHGTTSYSQMIGLIAYTGVGSRFVWVVAGTICVLCGIFSKVGAILALVPEPVIGGILLFSLSMVFSCGILTIITVDMTSPRNQIVLGLAFTMGISLPICVKNYQEQFITGHSTLDQTIFIFLSSGPIISGAVGFILDNVLPGSRESRGMVVTNADAKHHDDSAYNIPFTERLNGVRIFQWVPFLPCYKENICCQCCGQRKKMESLRMSDQHELDTLKPL